MIRPERVVLRRLRRLLRPPVAMRLHVGRSDEGDPADDLTRDRPQCHHGDALHDARLRPRPPAQLALEPELAAVVLRRDALRDLADEFQQLLCRTNVNEINTGTSTAQT